MFTPRPNPEVEVGYTNKGAITTEDQKTYYALIEHQLSGS
jgi:hypothetical protein